MVLELTSYTQIRQEQSDQALQCLAFLQQYFGASLHNRINYSKIRISRSPFGLPKSGLIREVVLISNIISSGKYHLG